MKPIKLALLSAACCGMATFSPMLTASASATTQSDAQGLVNDSRHTLAQLEADPHVRALLHRAKGVFIVPHFGQGGLIVGARGGEGVVLAHLNGRWSDPAFYKIGGVSVGAQAGAGAGSIVMLLMTPNALDDVMGSNNFSLNAKAGLSIVNYSAKSEAGWGRADVIVWSNVKGAYAGATVGVSDIAQAQDLDHAYYSRTATVNQILNGRARNPGANGLVRSLEA